MTSQPINDNLAAEVQARKLEKSQAKRKKRIRVAAITAGTLVFVIAVVCLIALNMLRTGGQSLHQAATDLMAADEAVVYDEGKTIQYDGRTYVLNENIISICIIGYGGYDPGTGRGRSGESDAVMVLALDTETGEATAIGIPRDSIVEVGEYVGDAFIGMDDMQLCLAFSFGDGGEKSCEYVTAIAQRVLYNMPISYYFAVDMDGIGPMANAVGGVPLTAIDDLPTIGVSEGDELVLWGKNAMTYIQWRDTTKLDSSIDRQMRQEQFIKAYASQALTRAKGDIASLLELYDTATAYSITSLDADEFFYLASRLVFNGITSLDAVTLQGEMQERNGYAAFYLDKDFVYKTVLDVYYTQVDETV